MDISYFLKLMAEKGASDMFLSTGAPVNIKVDGKLHPLGSNGLPPGMVKKIAYSMMSEGQVPEFEREHELNLAISVKQAGRFRVNVFRQRGEVSMVIRAIQSQVASIEKLRLPALMKDLIMEKRGLVLVVGSAGSGKSTSLAAMIDYRNRNATGHILTIEDPIEYLHNHHRSVVNQREIGFDTNSYHNALRSAMREAPDVILIGEIRDVETMEAAIQYAETGHLCLATLHSNNADQTMGRILNFFPESQHNQILQQLSLNLRGIISQRLIPVKEGNGRVPAVEVLLNTPRVADLMRNGEIYKIKEAMEKSLDDGMQTFDEALYNLYKADEITLEEALKNADSRDGLAVKIRFAEGDSSLSEEEMAAESNFDGTNDNGIMSDPYAMDDEDSYG
jgi:twitching motility protein PilU